MRPSRRHPFQFIALFLVFFLLSAPDVTTSNAQRMPSRRYDVPEKFGKLVEQHLTKMFKLGYFQTLDENDLGHGHVVVAKGYKEYDSLEKLLSSAELVLYHTDEYGGVWASQNHLPPEKRTQRSIVGYPNGNVQTAIELIPEGQRNTLSHFDRGTILVPELALKNPKKLHQGDQQDLLVSYEKGEKPGHFRNQFMIAPTANGRFSLGEIRYDIYFDVPLGF